MNTCLIASIWWQIRSQQEGKTLMKNETHFPLITEQPSNFAPGIVIFCFLPCVCLLRINSTYTVLAHWLEIVKCKGFSCIKTYLENAQLKILPSKLPFDLVWLAGLYDCSLAHQIPDLLAGKCTGMILILLFIPAFPHGVQGKPQHDLPVQWLWKGDAEPFHEIPHGFSMVHQVLEWKVPKGDGEASDLHPRHEMSSVVWK